jgi:hypothetical protein
VAAVAQRIDAPTGTNDDIVLGTLNYTFYDKIGAAVYEVPGTKIRIADPATTTVSTPAQLPGGPWSKALSAWGN